MRLVKQLYVIDMEQSQYSKTVDKILTPDIAVSMGCDVNCTYVGRSFADAWEIIDTTGKSDEFFVRVTEETARRIKSLKSPPLCRQKSGRQTVRQSADEKSKAAQ